MTPLLRRDYELVNPIRIIRPVTWAYDMPDNGGRTNRSRVYDLLVFRVESDRFESITADLSPVGLALLFPSDTRGYTVSNSKSRYEVRRIEETSR